MRKLRAGVVGVGNMGKLHVKNYSEMPNIELVGISDKDEDNGKKIASQYNCKFYKDYKELVKNEKLDIVSIAVPTSYHKEVAVYMMNNKVNVLVEKPIAGTIEDANEIIDAAEKNKVKLTIGHVERFNPAVIKLKEIIDSGVLGKISSIIARRVGVYPLNIKDADVIIDLAVHDIDIINYLLGMLPTAINANCGKSIGEHRHDYADILMKYDSISALVQVNWLTPVKIRKLNITGSKGYLEMDYITQEIELYESNYDKIPDDFGDFIVKFGTPNKINVVVEKEQPLKIELMSFIKSVVEDKDCVVTAEQALNALKIALQVNSLADKK